MTSALSSEPIGLAMQKEKAGYAGTLPWSLPQDGGEITAQRRG